MGISFSGIIEKALGGLIAGLFIFLIKSYSDDPAKFTSFDLLSYSDYWLIGGITIVGIILIIMLIQSKSKRGSWSLGPLWGTDYSAYVDVATIDYHDVTWIIARSSMGALSAADIVVKLPPRCPTCNIELEEKSIRFGNFEWKCVRGHFTKKSKNNFNSLISHVEKAARNDWEQGRIH